MSRNHRLSRIALFVTIVVGMLTPTVTWAAGMPATGIVNQAPVGVIVRRVADDGAAEALVAQLGGHITHDLSIIGSFSAVVPAWAVPLLEASTGVARVLPDRVATDSRDAVATATETAAPQNYYIETLHAQQVWDLRDAAGNPIDGRGVGIAIVDSGVSGDADLSIIARTSYNPLSSTANDVYGHGTHVAGIAAGKGVDSAGAYKGVAPGASIVSVKIADGEGLGYESDVVAGLQGVYNDAARYNIRVVNLSINCGDEVPYHQSALDAACEILWFNGIVVVTSAGNSSATGETYNTANAAPANDPFVITVGATNEMGTSRRNDDACAPFSMYTTTRDGFSKPDVLAPGTNIYSVLSKNSPWASQYPDRVAAKGEYFRLSGTSMAAPMVAGTVALMLQEEPSLNPDQVKWRITHGTDLVRNAEGVPTPYLDAYKAVTSTDLSTANTGVQASQLLWTGTDPVTWDSVMWRSVMWRSVTWDSVMWRSVMWRSVMWRSAYWGDKLAPVVSTTTTTTAPPKRTK